MFYYRVPAKVLDLLLYSIALLQLPLELFLETFSTIHFVKQHCH